MSTTRSKSNKGGLSQLHSPPGTANSAKRGDPKSPKGSHHINLDAPKKNVDPTNCFKMIVTGQVNKNPSTKYRSNPSNNTLSEDTLELQSAKNIIHEMRKQGKKNTTFVPMPTLSTNPKQNVTHWRISDFPPNCPNQDIGTHGICSTRVLTETRLDGSIYEFLDGMPHNPSMNASTTAEKSILGWTCDITESTAQFATNECAACTDIHPFLGPNNQADEEQKNKQIGKHYWEMRDRFDRLVMQHMIEVLESDLLPSTACFIIEGGHAWEFMTVKFPQEFPIKYQQLILPLIIQSGPIAHGTVLRKGLLSPRQAYTYWEAKRNVAHHLCGLTNYSERLIEWNLVGNTFCLDNAKNDNNSKEGSDVCIYTARHPAYTEGDNRVFVGRDKKHLKQLMTDEKLGKGCPDIYPQKKLLKGPQEIASLGLTIEIEDFWTYYQRRGSQMKLSDWGVQNREGAYKAWTKFVNDKRDKQNKKTSGMLKKGVGAIWGAMKSSAAEED